MKKGFVKTENYRRLAEAEKLVARRGAREAGLVLIRGKYGIGKSELTERWAAESGAVFVRAKATWTKRAMLDELADLMGLSKTGRNQEVQARIIGKLAVAMVPIIIDEADFMVGSTATLLEVIRDITDMTGIMCFLVGMEFFPQKVARFGHIASRVARLVDLQTLSAADIKSTVSAKAEVPIADDVLPLLAQQCDGRMRLLLGAITTIEQLAQANGWTTVTAEQLAGRTLCTEFTGTALGRRNNRGEA